MSSRFRLLEERSSSASELLEVTSAPRENASPGGALVLRELVFSCGPSDIQSVVRTWLVSGADNPAEGYTRADFETHLRAEHSTFSWLLKPMLERAGFEIESAMYSDSQVYATYECVRTTAPV